MYASPDGGRRTGGSHQGPAEADGRLQQPPDRHVWHYGQVRGKKSNKFFFFVLLKLILSNELIAYFFICLFFQKTVFCFLNVKEHFFPHVPQRAP